MNDQETRPATSNQPTMKLVASDELLDSCISKDQQIITLTAQLSEAREWIWEDRIMIFGTGLVLGLGVKVAWVLWL